MKIRLVESIKDDTIELHYDNMPYYYDDEEFEIEYDYECDYYDIVEVLADLLYRDNKKLYNKLWSKGEEVFDKYFEDNFQSLFDKYEEELLNHFYDKAQDAAQEADIDIDDYNGYNAWVDSEVDRALMGESIESITQSEQEYTSANTSINSSKLPAIFNLVKFDPNTINLDYGGGKFDNASEFLAEKEVTNLIYDPFNRSTEHNKNVLDKISANNGADTATLSNVLNVIKEENVRSEVLANIKKLLKPNGTLYITVYEGDGSGVDKATKAGYQLNRKTSGYLDEVTKVFGEGNVKQKGKLIIAKN